MRKCHALDEKMKEMDREITVNPQYVQKVSFREQRLQIILPTLCFSVLPLTLGEHVSSV